jgi:hypothetical protein
MSNDDLVYKKYVVQNTDIPSSILNNIYREQVGGGYTDSLKKASAEFNGKVLYTTWGVKIEFESEAHYTWFLMRFS